MIVFENKDWASNSLFPDSKFDENAKYWIEDNNKIHLVGYVSD